MWTEHTDVSHLTSKQLLSRDLKVVENIAVPGLPMLVANFLKLEGSVEAITSFVLEQKFDAAILIGLEAKESVQRDVAVYYNNQNKELLKYLLEELKTGKFAGNMTLGLKEVDVEINNIVYFVQTNIKATRKQIMPLIIEAARKYKQK